MEKICWENASYAESEVVIVGMPDESQSHSIREGTSSAPSQIRKISNMMDSYTRNGQKSLGYPVDGISRHVFDYGDVTRQQIPEALDRIMSDSKVPISIGGDHSVSVLLIKQIAQKLGNVSLVYFDAHPDFVTSTTGYYGSVFGDALPYIDIKTSAQIGTRTPEREEIKNLKKSQVLVITPFDIAEKGMPKISQQLLDHLGNNGIYISFDMDCIDPAHAPGVSVPVPMGISSLDAVFLLKKIASRGIVGMDIVEVCPPYDINDRTSHLASRMIGEVISSMK